jgi:tRNA nucleotidyltransferase (CCA-adding enzyme)
MPDALRADAVPEAVRGALAVLRGAGHEAWLVGGCVRDLLRGVAVADFDAATSATPAELLALFPRAVPIGVRHGTVMIPSRHGSLDVTTFRAGGRLADDLAHRDFTVNAIAWDPDSGRVVDPAGGAADLAAHRLAAVGSAEERFAEDPLRALRAARIAAALELEPDPAIEPAMRKARAGLRDVARERVRRELEALVVAPGAARGIALLRRTGIEQDLLPGAPDDAAEVVARMPRELVPRLAAWLRGTPAESLLLRLRFPKRTASAVARLVALHPIDARPLATDAELRRLLRRAGAAGVASLLALREAESGAALGALRARFEQVSARDAAALAPGRLALDGAAVMALLGCGPGPRVGAALRHLAECVLEDPERNTAALLAEELRRWADARS